MEHLRLDITLEVPPPGIITIDEDALTERVQYMDHLILMADKVFERLDRTQKSKERLLELSKTMGESDADLAQVRQAVRDASTRLEYIGKRINTLKLTKEYVVKKYEEEKEETA